MLWSYVVKRPDVGQALNSRSDFGRTPSSYPTSFSHRKGPLDFLCLVTRPDRIGLRISSHENIFSRAPKLLKDFGNSYLLSYTSESSCAFIVIWVFAWFSLSLELQHAVTCHARTACSSWTRVEFPGLLPSS